MNSTTQTTTLSVGWDVGGWNCDKNGTSRDAIVIIDDALAIVGKPWRGKLRATIADAPTLGNWLAALFAKCGLAYADCDMSITMAIDTPLGFPDAFVGLINGRGHVEADAVSGLNPYLFRQTKRNLFEHGLRPLSAVKDMIGSQATKGMHVLPKFAPHRERCGVWGDSAGFRTIETYPTACQRSAWIKARIPQESLAACRTWGVESENRPQRGQFLPHSPSNSPAMGQEGGEKWTAAADLQPTLPKSDRLLGHIDLDDALLCALTAHAFATEESMFDAPLGDVAVNEGWTCVPRT